MLVKRAGLMAGVCLLAGVSAWGQSVPQVFPLADTNGLEVHNVKVEAVEYKGRKAVHLSKQPGGDGFALLRGTDFQDGTIEADVALKVTTPPGVRMPGFIGVAFRIKSEASPKSDASPKPEALQYELFYLRPGNSKAEDQSMRNHSVQYCAEPGFGWYQLRKQWSEVYESYADLEPEQWTKMRIEVAGRSAKLFLNGSAKPSLVVDGLKGQNLHGGVALWGFANEEAYFSNLRITSSVAQAVGNGSEIAGEWELRFTSDYGVYDGSLKLTRAGNAVTGTWSGAFGDALPVKGSWRDGYVELAFTGTWPKEQPEETSGPAVTTLAGWVDGASAKGRMRVNGRADGQWSAKKK